MELSRVQQRLGQVADLVGEVAEYRIVQQKGQGKPDTTGERLELLEQLARLCLCVCHDLVDAVGGVDPSTLPDPLDALEPVPQVASPGGGPDNQAPTTGENVQPDNEGGTG